MKKFILLLASILALLACVPEASALPLFARQTGFACSACHFQHFPLLNSFGRSFKANGYTFVGSQEKVVEEGSLSIPAGLNFAGLTSFGYEKSNISPGTAAATHNTGNGIFYLPGVNGEASLFFGGHVSDFAGALAEVTLGGPNGALGSLKLPILFEVADATRVGVVPFATDAQGPSYTMELLNTGANAVHQISNTPGFNNAYAAALSAQQYIGTGGTANGFGLVATNPLGFVNLTKYSQTGTTGGTAASLGSTYTRAASTFDLANWDVGVGVQYWGGDSLWSSDANNPPTVGTNAFPTPTLLQLQQTKATAIDGQLQGELQGMPVGFYASYATAPAADPGTDPNTYNGGTLRRSSFNISGELGVIPQVATVAAAVRRANSGTQLAPGGSNLKDNALFLTGTYKLQQNMLARLSWVKNTGNFYDAPNAGANGATTNAQVFGTRTFTFNMYVLF
ncbi:MAG TPA: hypothetical protein VFF41_03730 [Gallionella sp.]|nr:hypothetical protein [Gallionella sp.]